MPPHSPLCLLLCAQEGNWPLLTVSKGFFETLAAKGGRAAAAAGGGDSSKAAVAAAAGGLDEGAMEGAGGGWGDDLDLGLGGEQVGWAGGGRCEGWECRGWGCCV